jgi:hypothetical protein
MFKLSVKKPGRIKREANDTDPVLGHNLIKL